MTSKSFVTYAASCIGDTYFGGSFHLSGKWDPKILSFHFSQHGPWPFSISIFDSNGSKKSALGKLTNQ